MKLLHRALALTLALAGLAAPASAACRLTPLVGALEAALSAAAAAPTADEREAARADAARRIAEGGDGSIETELYLMSRREALAHLADAWPQAAAAALAEFNLVRLAPRLAAEAATGDCPLEAVAEDRATGGVAAAKDWLGQSVETLSVVREEGGRAEALELADELTFTPANLLARRAEGLPTILFAAVGGALLILALGLRMRRLRLEGRYLCYLPAMVKADAAPQPARLVDFSRNGLKIAAPHIRAERDVTLAVAFLAIERQATVRWSRNGNIGVRLAVPLSDEEFEKVLHAGRGAHRGEIGNARPFRGGRAASSAGGEDHSATASFSISLPVA